MSLRIKAKYPYIMTINGCPHDRTQGDNYGQTCVDCGQVLGGYGFWGEGRKTCLHRFVSSHDPKYVECLYCQKTIDADKLD
ncbi:hypothetical protein GCM10007390_48850 [Persicitalea jodogahamensis]|uniref:Uncharacterized protein n=2 Tax=Persicitalea jodogahamensis TaxID=402147 RepID=A0A8J3D7V4_9BACT|nr:hypothetical protein GCM10007390_48850 [Persicitalea jodogahamensis]